MTHAPTTAPASALVATGHVPRATDDRGQLTVDRCGPEQADEWARFLGSSNNGTLFHDLRFLAYHPPQRFDTHHLMVYRGTKLAALLPAAIVTEPDGRRLLKSPYGASIGGPVLPPGLNAAQALELVARLQAYATDQRLDGIELRVGPSLYLREPNTLLDFSLMACGFRLERRWLSHVVPLDESEQGPVDRLFSKAKRYDVRTGLKNGAWPREVGVEGLPAFYELLLENQRRHGSVPTHTLEELADLFARVPGRVRLFLCRHDEVEVGGVLVFALNERVAYTFYICGSEAHARVCGPAVLLAHIMQRLAAEGFCYLDLGPSTFDDLRLNAGVAFFKEGLGGRGFCRDAWRWESDWAYDACSKVR